MSRTHDGLDGLFRNIADSIRGKTGSSASIVADNFPTAIDAIPTGVTPTGTVSITTNGTHDVTNYASANVNVSGGQGYTVKFADNAQITWDGTAQCYADLLRLVNGALVSTTVDYSTAPQAGQIVATNVVSIIFYGTRGNSPYVATTLNKFGVIYSSGISGKPELDNRLSNYPTVQGIPMLLDNVEITFFECYDDD